MKEPGIYGFTGEYRWLSNFYVEPDGTHVEGEYQRAKCAVAHERDLFHVGGDWEGPLKSPKECKALGAHVQLRMDWESARLDIMQFYVTKKFKDHEDLRRELKYGTRGLHLDHTNMYGDTFWGTVQGRGQNLLGVILMSVREEL